MILTGDGTPLVQVSLEPLLGDQRRFEWAGQQWVAAYRAMREPELRLALAAPTAPNTAPFAAAARRGLVGLTVVFGLSVVFTLLLSRGVTASIGSLAGAAEAVADGHLDRDPLRESGPDEVQRLGRAFNRMTASLRLLMRRVAQQESAAAVGEFAASLAHEIRNPLTSVRLDLERTRERLTPASEVDELVGRVLGQVERLDATVSGALRLARSGSLELGPLDLREPVAAALRTASPMLAERGVRLSAWDAPDEPLRVQANAAGVEQMLLNLLMNAADAVVARDDLAGGEHVWVETIASPGVVEMRVVDNGRGMSPQEHQRALEPFYTTRPEGTGLGLTVVKRIADAHGAELTIESEPGRGTRVTVTFHQNSNGRRG
jgi:two-component system sensor histidine kinase AtoS